MRSLTCFALIWTSWCVCCLHLLPIIPTCLFIPPGTGCLHMSLWTHQSVGILESTVCVSCRDIRWWTGVFHKWGEPGCGQASLWGTLCTSGLLPPAGSASCKPLLKHHKNIDWNEINPSKICHKFYKFACFLTSCCYFFCCRAYLFISSQLLCIYFL